MKKVDIFGHGHNPSDKYMTIPSEDWDLFIVENLSHKTIEEFFKYFSSLKKNYRNEFISSQFNYLQQLSKEKIKIIIGDFSHQNLTIDRRISELKHEINTTCYQASLDGNLESIKRFYKALSEEYTLRNNNYLSHIFQNKEEYIGIRFGSGHTIICKELKKHKYDLFLSLSPLMYTYGMIISRKLYLGLPVSDHEYMRGRITDLLSFKHESHTEFCKNIFGKSSLELITKDWNLIFPFYNALVDAYTGHLSQINNTNLHQIFTEQGLPDPLCKRIPRQQIRDFLQTFSINKYGNSVYYDRLVKQGMIS